ncbi:MAG: isoprenyl transferase [Desulfurispora sp.]
MFKIREKNKKDAGSGELSESELLARIDMTGLPRHIAIIMDGNGRWARARGMPRTYGHRHGMDSLREAVRTSAELGIQVLTVYAFSTENWKRPQQEVDMLMSLLVEYIHKEIDELYANNVVVRAIGDISRLPASAQKALSYAFERSRANTGMVLNIALNYGGRSELVRAMRRIAEEVHRGRVQPGEIDECLVENNLFTAGQPDPDLLIRPAGDYRVSNFLLWQMAYSEFWFCPDFWPDFRRRHLLQAIYDYQRRDRRFGGLKEGGK